MFFPVKKCETIVDFYRWALELECFQCAVFNSNYFIFGIVFVSASFAFLACLVLVQLFNNEIELANFVIDHLFLFLFKFCRASNDVLAELYSNSVNVNVLPPESELIR